MLTPCFRASKTSSKMETEKISANLYNRTSTTASRQQPKPMALLFNLMRISLMTPSPTSRPQANTLTRNCPTTLQVRRRRRGPSNASRLVQYSTSSQQAKVFPTVLLVRPVYWCHLWAKVDVKCEGFIRQWPALPRVVVSGLFYLSLQISPGIHRRSSYLLPLWRCLVSHRRAATL